MPFEDTPERNCLAYGIVDNGHFINYGFEFSLYDEIGDQDG